MKERIMYLITVPTIRVVLRNNLDDFEMDDLVRKKAAEALAKYIGEDDLKIQEMSWTRIEEGVTIL